MANRCGANFERTRTELLAEEDFMDSDYFPTSLPIQTWTATGQLPGSQEREADEVTIK
jgi:hypothetical protein